MIIRLYSYSNILHKQISEHNPMKQIDTNECPNIFVWNKLMQTNIHIENIWMYSSQALIMSMQKEGIISIQFTITKGLKNPSIWKKPFSNSTVIHLSIHVEMPRLDKGDSRQLDGISCLSPFSWSTLPCNHPFPLNIQCNKNIRILQGRHDQMTFLQIYLFYWSRNILPAFEIYHIKLPQALCSPTLHPGETENIR